MICFKLEKYGFNTIVLNRKGIIDVIKKPNIDTIETFATKDEKLCFWKVISLPMNFAFFYLCYLCYVNTFTIRSVDACVYDFDKPSLWEEYTKSCMIEFLCRAKFRHLSLKREVARFHKLSMDWFFCYCKMPAVK